MNPSGRDSSTIVARREDGDRIACFYFRPSVLDENTLSSMY